MPFVRVDIHRPLAELRPEMSAAVRGALVLVAPCENGDGDRPAPAAEVSRAAL
jgi:hypothetical protein